jgi:5-methylcytosine-specific restriction enzyme subunit McrC
VQTLVLREGDKPRLVELRRPIADALSSLGVIQLGLTERTGWWEAAAGTKIGVVTVGELQVVIQPKIDIGRLIFLMGYARNPSWWRDDRVRLEPASDLPEALADAFVRLARRALEQGLLTGYTTVEETLPVLRGRIREADQVRRRWGLGIPLEVRYDDYTVDIPENRLLLAAVETLLRSSRSVVRHKAGLQRLRLQLADVTPLQRGAVRPRWTASRLNARYVPALEIAELVLAGHSFEQRLGDLVVTGYLFNMATIFEDFVTVGIREAMSPFGGQSRLQYETHLDDGKSVPIRPDYVWLNQQRPCLVVDAKYKAEKPSGFPQADLYQMHAYCTVLGLPVGHLIYAKGNEDSHEHVVKRAGTRIIAHTLDLAASPSEILAQLTTLTREMVAQSLPVK